MCIDAANGVSLKPRSLNVEQTSTIVQNRKNLVILSCKSHREWSIKLENSVVGFPAQRNKDRR